MHRHFKNLTETQQLFINLVYIQAHTYESAAQKMNISIEEVKALNKEFEVKFKPVIDIKNRWKSKEAKDYKLNPDGFVNSNFWDFYHWIKTTPEVCEYCRITQQQLNRLHKIGIENKRTTRGRTLEIDRKKADEPYSNLKNLTYACYWCNNAKTDTFTEEEFKIIGKAIGKVWQKRLADDNR